MWSFLDATSTNYNSTTWRAACSTDNACRVARSIGYGLVVLEVLIIAWLCLIARHIVLKAKQRRASVVQENLQARNGARKSTKGNKDRVSIKQIQKRFHYKLHTVVALVVNDIVWVLLVLLGQYGQNVSTNCYAQVYAYGMMAIGAVSHVSHVSAYFNTRRMKEAVRAMRKQQQVNNTNEHDDNAINAENRKYVLWASSIPILLHIVWVVFAGLNQNLNPINFVRMLQLITSLPQALMAFVNLIHVAILFATLQRMPVFNDEQQRHKETGTRRLRKRLSAALSSLLIGAIGLLLLHPICGTMSGWLVASILQTLSMGIVNRLHIIRLLTAAANRQRPCIAPFKGSTAKMTG